MADRTSAALFADVFDMLAADGPLDRDALARFFCEKSREYDFCWQQMGCDDALVKLGLLRKGVDPECPEDGEAWLFGPAEPAPDAPRAADQCRFCESRDCHYLIVSAYDLIPFDEVACPDHAGDLGRLADATLGHAMRNHVSSGGRLYRGAKA